MLRTFLPACLVAALVGLVPGAAHAADPSVTLVGIRVVADTMTVHYHAENIPPDEDWTLQFSWDGCSGGFNRALVTQAGTFDGSFDVDASFVGSGWRIQTFPGASPDELPDVATASLDPRLDFTCNSANATSFTVGNPPAVLDPVQNTALPMISGTARVGTRLTASTGTWSPAASYAYQWLVDGAVLGGQTSPTYVPPAELRGRKLSVRVTATQPGWSTASATSVQTAPVAAGIIANTVLPSITGTKRVGAILTARPGTWTPGGLTFRYQWFKGSTAIRGASARTYRIPASLRRAKVRVRVTAVRTGYVGLTRFSAATSAIR